MTDWPTTDTLSMTSGYKRALGQEIEVAQLARAFLEHVDEGRTNDLPLLFRIRHVREALEKQIRRVHELERQSQSREPRPNLLCFVQPQQAVVDEDARQAVPNRAVQQDRGDRRVDTAREPTHDPPLAHLRPNPRDALLHKRRHRPIPTAAADVVGEVAKDRRARFGVGHLGMKEQRVESARRILHGRHGRVRGRGDHGESGRRVGDEIAVAGPDLERGRQPREQCRPRLDLHRRVAELATRGTADRAAEHVRHQLHAVANAERGDAKLEHRRVRPGRSGIPDRARSARKDDARGAPPRDVRRRRRRRQNFGIHRQFTQAPRNQLRVLRAKIEDKNRLMCHRGGNVEARARPTPVANVAIICV